MKEKLKETIISGVKGIKQILIVKKDKDEYKVKIAKVDEGERQLSYGVVLRADVEDRQGHTVPAEEVEKAAHKWMARSRHYDYQHVFDLDPGDAEVVESFIAPVDMFVVDEKPMVVKGDWVVVTHYKDKNLWERVKKGDIQAYSIRGFGIIEETNEVDSTKKT